MILLLCVLFRIEIYYFFEKKSMDFWQMICYIGYGIDMAIKFNNVHLLGFLFKIQEGVIYELFLELRISSPAPTERIHFYGHSHIVAWSWGKKDTWRRICRVDWHDVPQIGASSFGNIRGQHFRSVFLPESRSSLFFRSILSSRGKRPARLERHALQV